jgi:hypothetical protein
MGETYGKYKDFINCNSFRQCYNCFVFKLCKLTIMNQVEEEKKTTF